jgi:hypothetical protein
LVVTTEHDPGLRKRASTAQPNSSSVVRGSGLPKTERIMSIRLDSKDRDTHADIAVAQLSGCPIELLLFK